MKTKHTPGPWGVTRPYEESGIYVEAANPRKSNPLICKISESLAFGEGDAKSNARLIAAAPELLEACNAVIDWAKEPGNHGGNPYCKEFVQLAQAAIAKALGQ